MRTRRTLDQCNSLRQSIYERVSLSLVEIDRIWGAEKTLEIRGLILYCCNERRWGMNGAAEAHVFFEEEYFFLQRQALLLLQCRQDRFVGKDSSIYLNELDILCTRESK